MVPLAFLRNMFGVDGFVVLVIALLIFGRPIRDILYKLRDYL